MFLIVGFSLAAFADSPHFVGKANVSVSGNELTVSAKEVGLDSEGTIDVSLTSTALCINGGGHNPKAVNKTSVAANAVEQVHNGMSDYTISATATFSPPCSPPMTVEFTKIMLTDNTNNIN